MPPVAGKSPAMHPEASQSGGLTMITSNMTGLRTDEDMETFLNVNKSKIAVVNFGSSWCTHCQALFPNFLRLAGESQEMEFAVAQVDYMQSAASHVTFTPTLAIFRRGRKVDEFHGSSPQQIRDRVWLQKD
uniref:Thioredoxin domain-containing protein n=1 Tax=Auxenochlorella protothecoides TaxID=3075 RepID=A0A1D1ZPI2_AUXPR